ncbi:MAG: DEAD/DEAH box helicase family protein [Geminicoccaceae bacterium]|nr:DEAD/DEAH box helicase family protein [Geminicoccaceae bacterium]
MPPLPRSLRTHQRAVANIVAAIAAGGAGGVGDILAAVTPGGGKSLLPVIAAARLVAAGVVERVCWVVPRDSLRLQAEEAFADPSWREALDHRLAVRAADNEPDPCRGLAGYVTTYQAVAAAPGLHLAECRRRPTLLVVDEMHHLPALRACAPTPDGAEGAADDAGADEAAAWSTALLPLLACARLRLLLSGTLERADGRPILWLPYRRGSKARTHEVDLEAPGWAVVGYSRAQALAERAVLPVTFGALDGEARWLEPETGAGAEGDRAPVGPHRLSAAHPTETTRPALFTALRTGFAETLLRRAFEATRGLRARRRAQRDIEPGGAAPGLGKLLVVAPDQACARRYLDVLRAWMPRAGDGRGLRLAVSDERDAHEALAAFRLTPEPSVLVTVAMAYEGLDAPEVAVVAALTHVRSRPWLEQMVARATRVDPHGGAYEGQRALVFHPDDPLFARFRWRVETEQGTLARQPAPAKRPQALPAWLREQIAGREGERGIVPLESNALGLRYVTLRPGPAFARARPEREEARAGPDGPPSVLERRLRARLAEMVAAQVVEDEAGLRVPRGVGLYHRYNAALKRVLGDKGRARMTLDELEAALAWLERNRLADHLHLLDGDARYAWTARRRAGKPSLLEQARRHGRAEAAPAGGGRGQRSRPAPEGDA